MKKIPCVFKRNFTSKNTFELLEEPEVGCEWVLAGEGIATRKWDGTAVAIIDGKLYARYDAKSGKPAPDNGIPCCDPDPITGHWPHWVPADRAQDVWIRTAFDDYYWYLMNMYGESLVADGTYEAIGPKIGGNAENADHHKLVKHGEHIINVDPSYNSIKDFLTDNVMEGIVFHHPDGRMAKIRRADFKLKWPVK